MKALPSLATVFLTAIFTFLPTLAAGQGHSYQEEVDAVLYGQSFLVQAMMEVCNEAFPEDAAVLDKTWAAWEKKNRRSVKRGKKAYAKIEKISDPDASVQKMAEEMGDQIRGESAEELSKTCATVLEVLERESR